jgi:hypothetical protein
MRRGHYRSGYAQGGYYQGSSDDANDVFISDTDTNDQIRAPGASTLLEPTESSNRRKSVTELAQKGIVLSANVTSAAAPKAKRMTVSHSIDYDGTQGSGYGGSFGNAVATRSTLAEHETMIRHAHDSYGIRLSSANPLLNLISNASRITLRGPRRVAWATKIVRNIYDAMAEELAAAMGYTVEEANAKGVVDRAFAATILPERCFNRFALGLTDSAKAGDERLLGKLPAGFMPTSASAVAAAANDAADEAQLDVELVDFVSEVMTHKYGLKALVDQKIWDLMITLQYHVNSSQPTPELSLFDDFLQKRKSNNALALHLHMRRRLQSQSDGVWLPQVGDGMLEMVEYVDFNRAKALLQELYGMNWAERAKVVAARASTLPEDQIPPAYRPFIKIMASQASQAEEACSKAIMQLKELCTVSPELSALAEAQPTKVMKEAPEFEWITVVQLVELVSNAHSRQRERLQLHKWLTNRFSIVDNNRDRFISCEEFVRIFSGPDIQDATKFPTARELSAFFTRTVEVHGAAGVQEMSFGLFSNSACQYLISLLDSQVDSSSTLAL